MKLLLFVVSLLLSITAFSMENLADSEKVILKRKGDFTDTAQPSKKICEEKKTGDFSSDDSYYRSYESDENEDQSIIEWRDQRSQELSAHSFIKLVQGRLTRGNQPLAMIDVDMDQCHFGCEGEVAIGTYGVGPCMAVCAVGINGNNKAVLALAHMSFITHTPQSILEYMLAEFEKKSCKKESVKFYIVGGNLLTIRSENKFLDLSKVFNIIGVQFNPLDLDMDDPLYVGVNVVLTARGVFYGPKLKFDIVEQDSKSS